MYHRVRRKMYWHFTLIAILILGYIHISQCKSIHTTEENKTTDNEDNFDNNIIDFDSIYNDKLNKQNKAPAWHENDKESHRYTVIKANQGEIELKFNKERYNNENKNRNEMSLTTESSFIPVELMSTTEDAVISLVDSTEAPDLTVIPLSSTQKTTPGIEISTIMIPTSTPNIDTSTNESYFFETTDNPDYNATVNSNTEVLPIIKNNTIDIITLKTGNFSLIADFEFQNNATVNNNTDVLPIIKSETIETTTLETGYFNLTADFEFLNRTTEKPFTSQNKTNTKLKDNTNNSSIKISATTKDQIETMASDDRNSNSTKTNATTLNNTINIPSNNKITNSSKNNDTINRFDESGEVDVPIFTELDVEDEEVPEDYYDAKDVVPTKPPNVDALSIIFGLAGSVVESVAERVVPKGIFNLYKRMQKQNEALEAERLRSREENGGIGQFGRGILKTISTGLSAPFTQLMAGARDNGSLDSDRGFVSGVASGVTNVANSVVDAFKTRVQAIYPGTLWCGDGHSAQARSSDLGLFFFTDTCCRQHDACKLYIRSGDTKHGLTNTGLFTRSHCSCDLKFRSCLQKTGSLVSGQIGLTYFNVLGPQCFRKAHPIVRCVRRTRITGQKCEEYELDYTKPKMWQWFDNETF